MAKKEIPDQVGDDTGEARQDAGEARQDIKP
jgi:hypothetical protein